MRKKYHADRVLIALLIALLAYGFFIFVSAALGLLARDGQAEFFSVVKSQAVALIIGLGACYIGLRVPLEKWRALSPLLYIIGIIGLILVLIPGLGITINGAQRWLSLGFTSIQPVEVAKAGYILFLGSWLVARKKVIESFKLGFVPYLVITAIPAALLAMQPDNDSIIVIGATGLAMAMALGAKSKHIWGTIGLGVLALVVAYFTFPYVQSRIESYLNPAADARGAGYQVQQSLIAIGSGGFFGRGFGQSIQKFHYLPEPINDSIFAVQAEEFGFMGSLVLVLLILMFSLRGFHISARASTPYATALGVGVTSYVTIQAFLNIASMLAIIPLSGLPLLFVSHGGTALVIALFLAGILLNVSTQRGKEGVL
jgi:cell division protein FtsW